MLELLLVGVLVALLVAVGAGLSWLAWSWLVGVGVGLIALGLGFGVPTGLLYHVRLRAALRTQDALPPRWWLYPTRLHDDLDPERRRWVMRPFYAGAAGFVAIILGCGVGLVGFFRSPWAPP